MGKKESACFARNDGGDAEFDPEKRAAPFETQGCGTRPFARKRMDKKKSACFARNDGGDAEWDPEKNRTRTL